MQQLKMVIEASGSTEMEEDRVRVDVAASDADSALMHVGTYRRRYFYY